MCRLVWFWKNKPSSNQTDRLIKKVTRIHPNQNSFLPFLVWVCLIYSFLSVRFDFGFEHSYLAAAVASRSSSGTRSEKAELVTIEASVKYWKGGFVKHRLSIIVPQPIIVRHASFWTVLFTDPHVLHAQLLTLLPFHHSFHPLFF